MTTFLILVAVFGAAALYFMTPEERTRLAQATLRGLRVIKDVIILEGTKSDEYADALKARTSRTIAGPAFIALTATFSIITFFDPRSLHDGWRHVATGILASPTLIDLLINAVCLFQIALVLERLVGPLVFAAVYFSAGMAAGLVGLPAGAHLGASASVLGLYGLLIVVATRGALRGSPFAIPMAIAQRMAAVFAVFVLWRMTSTGLMNLPTLAALVAGVIGGLAVARDVDEHTPPLRRLATCMGIFVAIAGTYALAVALQPRETVVDIGPDIQRVIALETQTADMYDQAVSRFTKRRIRSTDLIDLIEHTIRPELGTVAARLRSLQDVSPEQKRVIAAAEEFLRFRDQSWAMRAEALHKSDMMALRQADAQEQLSLTALQRVKALTIPRDRL